MLMLKVQNSVIFLFFGQIILIEYYFNTKQILSIQTKIFTDKTEVFFFLKFAKKFYKTVFVSSNLFLLFSKKNFSDEELRYTQIKIKRIRKIEIHCYDWCNSVQTCNYDADLRYNQG